MSPSQRPSRESASFGRVLLTFTVTLAVLVGLGLGLRALTQPPATSSEVAENGSVEPENETARPALPASASVDEPSALPASATALEAQTAGAEALSAVTSPATSPTSSPPTSLTSPDSNLSSPTSPEPTTILDSDDLTAGPAVEPIGPVDFETAEAAFYAGDYEEASVLFAAYLTDHDNPWGYYMKGLADWKANDLDAAENALLDCLDRNPDHIKALVNLARVRMDNGKAEEAVVPIERALSLDPDHSAAMRVHARVLHNSGERTEAESAYLAVIERNETDAWSMNNLGLIRIESREFTRAVPPLARAVAIDSSVACFHNNLGVALEGAGDYRGALQAYVSAVEVDPAYAKASASRDRISHIVDAQSRESVNLAEAAEEFLDELHGSQASNGLEVVIEDGLADSGVPVTPISNSASTTTEVRTVEAVESTN